jgi:hypothetical protein
MTREKRMFLWASPVFESLNGFAVSDFWGLKAQRLKAIFDF